MKRRTTMFNPNQYSDKAADYAERAKTAIGPIEARALAEREKSFTSLADNEQWLSDNHQKTIQASGANAGALAEEEDRVLRCLGAALIMQWNTLSPKLQ